MHAERWSAVEALFAQALTIPVADRDAYLSAAPVDDDVRAEVRSLLAHVTLSEDGRPNSLEAVVAPVAAAWSVVGAHVGAYRIVSIIGHGGMGAVYKAERADGQFDQTVAVKFVRHGFETDSALERFRQERQLLARLEHPDIARLIDGGTTSDRGGADVPFLVMEYVDGLPITAYCQRHALTVSDRLRLFRRVCGAVQYAHQHLVIHRDLKPSNILVTSQGSPRLLDFGLARLVDATGKSSVTLTGGVMFTPDYASPEHVRGEAVSVSADVYSLGAVLFELLADARPHQFRTLSPSEIDDVICRVEPLRPSDAAPPDRRRAVAGDLDRIVRMAMHKDAARRYASVDQLSDDIDRFLTGMPVRAHEDSWAYRAVKFTRRHLIPLSAAALVAITLVTGIVVSVRAQRQAERRFNDVRAMADTMLSKFEVTIRDLPGALPARKLLVETATAYLDQLAAERSRDNSLLLDVARGYNKVGNVQAGLQFGSEGALAAARTSYQKALAALDRMTVADVETARWRGQTYMGLAETFLVEGDRAGALREFARATDAVARALAQEPTNGSLAGVAASAANRQGDILMEAGDIDSAAARFADALKVAGRASQDPRRLATTRARIALAVREQGRLAEAEQHFRSIADDLARASDAQLSYATADTLARLEADRAIALARIDGPSLNRIEEGRQLALEALRRVEEATARSNGDHNATFLRIDVTLMTARVLAGADPAVARAKLDAALRLGAAALVDHPNDAALRSTLAEARSVRAAALLALNLRADARTDADQALAELDSLIAAHSANVSLRDARVLALLRSAATLDGPAARQRREQALAEAEGLARSSRRPAAQFLVTSARNALRTDVTR